MLYFLYQITYVNLFQYITVRAGIAFFLGFCLHHLFDAKIHQMGKIHATRANRYTL